MPCPGDREPLDGEIGAGGRRGSASWSLRPDRRVRGTFRRLAGDSEGMGTMRNMSNPTLSDSPVHASASAAWALRLAGLSALVNGAGFGAFDIPAILHLARDQQVWHAYGKPTYGKGPFEDHGITVTVPVLVAFLGACLVLAIGGLLLLVPRPTGVVVTLAGLVTCAPFWWGFALPFAWLNAATVLALLAMAGLAGAGTRGHA